MSSVRFAVVCEARTGSNLLCGLLNSHPDILCHHEVFNQTAIWYAFGYRDGAMTLLGDVSLRDRAPGEFLARLWAVDHGHQAVGIKILRGQGARVLPQILADRNVKKIILRRRNRVRAFVSLARATQSGHFAHQSYDGLQIQVDQGELLQYVSRYEAFYSGLDRAVYGQNVLRCAYEDLSDPNEQARILGFLQVHSDPDLLEPLNRKQSHDRLDQAIINYGSLLRRFRGGSLAHELSDHQAPIVSI